MPALDIVIYIAAFLAVYMQVFLFVTFIQKRKFVDNGNGEVDLNLLPAITFLVPCWNEEKKLDTTILSLRKIDYPKEKFFIIIIDDGSIDGTWKEMQKYKNDSQIQIFTQKNSGKYEALNNGLRHASTNLVASIDADTIIKEDALLKAMQYFIKDKDLASLGCSVLIKSPKTFIQKAQSIEYQMFSFSKKVLDLLNGVLVVPGAFSIFKKPVLLSIGGWKAGNGMEDLELTYRLQVNGYKIAHCHNAIAFTSGPKTLKTLFKQRLRWAYGFLRTTYDYRSAIFNRKFGNFGFYTLPTALISYIVILTIFSISWYRIFNFIYDKILAYRLIGFNAFVGDFSFSWFFVNTKAIVFITIVTTVFLILNIFLGRYISQVKDKKFGYLIYFFVIYSVILPFWVLRSVFNAFLSNKPSWR